MKTHQWSNVPGSVTLELSSDEGPYLGDLQNEVGFEAGELEFLRPFLSEPNRTEISINFISNGEHTPMSMHGGPDGLGWPEEGAEERLFQSADVLIDGKLASTLPPEIGQRLFDLFHDQVEAAELEYDRE